MPSQAQLSPDDLVKRGTGRVDRIDSHGALEDVAKALESEPNHVGAIFLRGRVALLNKDFERALADMEAALAKDPNLLKASNAATQGMSKDYTIALQGAGLQQVRAGHPETGLPLLDKALNSAYAKSNPEIRAIVAIDVSQAHELKGDWKKAVEVLSEALKEAPPSQQANLVSQRSRGKRALGDLKGCSDDLDAAFQATVGPGEGIRRLLLAERGVTRRLAGDFQGALEDLDAIIKEGNDPSLRLQRAMTFLQMNKSQDAEKEFADFLALNSGGAASVELAKKLATTPPSDGGKADAEELTVLSRDALKVGDYVGAVLFATRAIEADPNHQPAYEARGEAYFYLSDPNTSLCSLSQALNLDSRDFFALFYRSVARHQFIQDYNGALEDATMGIQVQPAMLDLCTVRRAEVLMATHHYPEAVSDYTAAIGIQQSASSYVQRGLAFLGLNRQADAEADFLKARELGFSQSELDRVRSEFRSGTPMPLASLPQIASDAQIHSTSASSGREVPQPARRAPVVPASAVQATPPVTPTAPAPNAPPPLSANPVAENSYRSGLNLLQMGKVSAARAIFAQAVRLDPALKPHVEAALRDAAIKP